MSDSQRKSRRAFLRGWLGSAQSNQSPDGRPRNDRAQPNDSIPLQSAVRSQRSQATLPIHRPPGAINEAAFLLGCTRCNDCAAACPVDAIFPAPARFRAAAGTPMIDPYSNPCVLCADMPCIRACKPAVLRLDQPHKMGVAYIEQMACLAYAGSFCSVCSEQCPVPGAITVVAGKPKVREHDCTGCGVCAASCPAPARAIVVLPLADRPPPFGRS